MGRSSLAFAGAVLTGGASTRMGRDKAVIEVDGVALGARVAGALRAAGAVDVVCVGLAVPGEVTVDDEHPGAGPLGGLVTALRWAPADVLVVAPCDLVHPSAAALGRTVERLASIGQVDVAVPVVAGREQWLHSAWWVPTCRVDLAAVFDAGERSVHRAVADLVVLRYEERDDDLLDADRPGDLPPGAG